MFLSLPPNYDRDAPHKLIFGFPGDELEKGR